MSLLSKPIIKDLLQKHNAPPLKRFGQHFLIDKAVLQKIIKAADIQKNDVTLEIGPGIGTLTQELAKRAGRVLAVEKDRRMIDILKETLVKFRNVELVEGDILKNFQFSIFNFQKIFNFQFSNSYKVVANLPYYIVAPVIRMFLEAENPPTEMVLMVQKEVAQRVCAKPPKMSLLAVAVQFYAKPEIISYVSKKCFWPRPKVDGAIIKLKVKSENLKVSRNLFFKIMKAGFAHPRKQLINNLSAGLKIDKEKIRTWLQENDIQPEQRAETLSVENWLGLTKTFLLQ